ncbi:replication protein RepA [uncultured Enterovirga sp.]|uniref:replication protein RepA n=1 Tax=uncultured Enterovirga sp. TaxID=2026352 RepID=UPI0035CB5043
MSSESRQLSLWERALLPPEPTEPSALEARASSSLDGRMDVTFLHKGFCIAGLPLRKPKDTLAPWSRQDGRFSLTVEPARFILPDGRPLEVGVPFGPKARLLTMWLATEARDHRRSADDRWMEMGRITEWLQAVGLPVSGGERGSIGPTKDQLVRLTFPVFTMVLKDDADGHVFKRETLIESGAFGNDDLELWAAGKHSAMKWPRGLMLSRNAHERFTRHSIPIPTGRLRQVAHNAMAIDILVYLCYRLPMISHDDSELLTWRDLMAQFGSSEFASRFKQAFSESIKRTLDAYPEANVTMTSEGLLMRRSDPAELRRAFITVPSSKGASTRRLRSPTGPRRSAKPALAIRLIDEAKR